MADDYNTYERIQDLYGQATTDTVNDFNDVGLSNAILDTATPSIQNQIAKLKAPQEQEIGGKQKGKTRGEAKQYERRVAKANKEFDKPLENLEVSTPAYEGMWDAMYKGGSRAVSDIGAGLAYAGGKLKDTFDGDDLSDYTKSRRQYALSKGLKDMYMSGSNREIDNVNNLAGVLGYNLNVKKAGGKDYADRIYNEALGSRAEKNDEYRQALGQKYMQMLDLKMSQSKNEKKV